MFHFSIFFTDMGVKLLDITFSIVKVERLVIGKPLDSIIINLGKVDSIHYLKKNQI